MSTASKADKHNQCDSNESTPRAKGGKLARRARSFKEDFLDILAQMRSPSGARVGSGSPKPSPKHRTASSSEAPVEIERNPLRDLDHHVRQSFHKTQEKEKSPIDGRTRKDASVESFEFKRPKTPGQPLRSSSRKKSSLSTNSSHLFKTPMSKRRLTPGSVITPKLQCNTPMTMMRRPQLGEVAVSMSGSPLLVRPFAGEDVPTVNVPLQDGRVFSIMPEDGGSFLDLPFDEATKQHLRTLRAHLEILAAD